MKSDIYGHAELNFEKKSYMLVLPQSPATDPDDCERTHCLRVLSIHVQTNSLILDMSKYVKPEIDPSASGRRLSLVPCRFNSLSIGVFLKAILEISTIGLLFRCKVTSWESWGKLLSVSSEIRLNPISSSVIQVGILVDVITLMSFQGTSRIFICCSVAKTGGIV